MSDFWGRCAAPADVHMAMGVARIPKPNADRNFRLLKNISGGVIRQDGRLVRYFRSIVASESRKHVADAAKSPRL